jgi:hypothetical protein
MYQPEQVCLGLVLAPCEEVLRAVRIQLEGTIEKGVVHTRYGTVEWERFFEGHGLLDDMRRFQIVFFSPHEGLTAYVCNLVDGWVSLYDNAVRNNVFDAYFFRATLSESEYQVFEMKGWRSGVLQRELRVIKDEAGWDFVNKGTPVPIESPMQYKRRRIGARLDRGLIDRYSDAVGCRVGAVTQFRGQCWRVWRNF